MSMSIENRKEMIGWESPAYEVTLTRRGIREFAEATYLDDAAFKSVSEARAAGFSDLPAPPTFFGSVFFVNFEKHEPELGFEAENTLHGEQGFEFERVPVAGETLYVKNRLVDVYEKVRSEGGKITFAEFEKPIRDADGDLVLTAYKNRLEVLTGDE